MESKVDVIKILEHLGVAIVEVNALQARCEKLEKALRELVRLKELKDKHGKTEEYIKSQPIAWELANEALSGEGKEVDASDDAKNKAWDEWRDSLVKSDNALVHYKERPEKYFEPFTLDEFKAVMLEKSPAFIYNTNYSATKPLYQITSQFMPSGVDFFCTSWADKTPQRETLDKFYHRLKMDGLEYARF